LALSSQALLREITINGVAVKANQTEIQLDRKAALDLTVEQGEALLRQTVTMPKASASTSLTVLLADRVAILTTHQTQRYAKHYSDVLDQV